MSLSSPFIQRPVATTLITVGIAIAGMLAFFKLPVAPLPQVDFPTISVSAQLPGASPETVATSLAEPLERALGIIADVTEMTSQNSLGQTRIILQFGLDRDINGAARDVEAAINAARALLPTNLPNNPTYRQVNPADAPIMVLALTSDTLSIGQVFDAASNAGRAQSERAFPLWHRSRRHTCGHRIRQCGQSERNDLGRQRTLPNLYE
jgi:multidrug efflux pump